jgi:hypothetical protein
MTNGLGDDGQADRATILGHGKGAMAEVSCHPS